jgi:hypothetical protein
MATYCVVDTASGLILNRILLDAGSDWTPEVGHSIAAEGNTTLQISGTYIAGVYTPPAPPPAPPPLPQTVLSQDLMAQFTAADAVAIQTAIAGSQPFWLLWYQLQAQKDPMLVTNARFLAGWNALIQVLGQPRMTAIATTLGVTI